MYPDNYMNPMNNPMTNPNYGYNRMQQVQQMQSLSLLYASRQSLI